MAAVTKLDNHTYYKSTVKRIRTVMMRMSVISILSHVSKLRNFWRRY